MRKKERKKEGNDGEDRQKGEDRERERERERERDIAYTCMRPIACSVYQIDRWTERYHHDT
jgi:hypothetical protein